MWISVLWKEITKFGEPASAISGLNVTATAFEIARWLIRSC